MSRNCPKCQGSMSRGFIANKNHDGSLGTLLWVEGEPVKSVWTGLKLKGKTQLEIQTFRCSRCHFLEHYASA